jgi:hypothetical protein
MAQDLKKGVAGICLNSLVPGDQTSLIAWLAAISNPTNGISNRKDAKSTKKINQMMQ